MKTVEYTYFGSISDELNEIAKDCAAWADTIEEAQADFTERAGEASNADLVSFYYAD